MSKHFTRIMYIENKTGGLVGPARIGRVTFSKTMRSIHYDGKTLQKTKSGFKDNFFDVDTGEEYWVSGPKKAGGDGLYGANGAAIDEDVREEYWEKIRQQPSRKAEKIS
jgi:hypothetical protein